jgi:hypothetical protein
MTEKEMIDDIASMCNGVPGVKFMGECGCGCRSNCQSALSFAKTLDRELGITGKNDKEEEKK